MHNFDNGFMIVCLFIGFVSVNCESDYEKDETESDKDEDVTPEDLYSFLALIDVVFTDGFKKTCTGTIIHDYVVITAAHCFKVDDDNIIQAELTASFVVIGTKKMFDTGYEQYLPIERIIIHPNYSGWTADLALVYTFAGMMSDKPGRIVPLANEKTSTPVDSDVTVFSWGQYKISEMASIFPSKIEKCSEEDRYEALNGRIGRIGNQKDTSDTPLKSTTAEDNEQPSITSAKMEISKTTPKQNKRQRQRRKKRKNRKRIRKRKQNIENQEQYHLRQSSTETRSKYRHRPLRYGSMTVFDTEAEQLSWETNKRKLKRFYKGPTTEVIKYSRQFFRATSYYRNNWRRKMGNQQNKLTVEVFGFVNMQMCKKLVEKAKSTLYELRNPNEVLCYASEAHFITEVNLTSTLLIKLGYTNLNPSQDDSGAPAMRRGRLVAVTVGGVDFDGERVAIGMKMICFCSWISENIPKSGTKWQCCKNCCETKDDTEQNHHLHFRHEHSSKTRSTT